MSGLDLSIPDFLDTAARAHPSRVALAFGSQRWTFLELQRAVVTAAANLATTPSPAVPPLPSSRERGSGGAGERLGILSPNRPGFAFAALAAARLGIPYVPLNWRLTPSELAWQLREAGVTLLLVDEALMETAMSASAGLPVSISPIADLEQLPDPGIVVPPAPSIALDREALVIFTSGSTGRPKGARLTYGNLWFSAVGSALHLGQRPDDVWLAALPMFHIGGLSILYRGLIGANSVVLHDRFDPDRVRAAIDDGATHVSLVPTTLRQILDQHRGLPWPGSLRCVLLGGAAAPPDLIDECIELGIPVAPTYGLTESSSQATTLRPSETILRRGSSGLPLPVTQVRIVEQGHVMPPGHMGEIELRGPTIFAGYLGDDGQPFGHDGWLATGDAGYVDADGYLYVADRRDDLIVSGGENVYPAEIERVLLEHPLVRDAGVVGVSSEPWGARPIAFVVWDGEPASAQPALLAHCRPHLAGYKIPDRIVVVDALPRSPSGKLSRRRLRNALFAAEIDPP
jgi:O-succinylbenzoic acid--CoA ligase